MAVGGGRYILGRQEGRGGFSICYRAWDGLSNEICAVKELFTEQVCRRVDNGAVRVSSRHQIDFDEAINSLRHEGEVLAKLTKEPAIVQVRDVFEENGTAYLSMEHLRGQSYEKYLYRYYVNNNEYISVDVTVNVALTIIGAIAAVHARDLLHLDVKPANIRVLSDARIVLLDFGSARDAFRQGNGIYGDTFTPGFAALEQHSAEGEVTVATDVYGLAATLYYSLCLAVPTPANERQNGAKLKSLTELNPAVPPELDLIIQKAMALDPDERYSSIADLRMALQPFANPYRPAPSRPDRIIAGLLDVVTSLLILAAIARAETQMPPVPLVAIGVLLWWLTQLLPLVAGATPGMLIKGLRLTDQLGKRVKLKALLIRSIMLMVAIGTFRIRLDSDGLMMHDSVSRTRVVVTK